MVNPKSPDRLENKVRYIFSENKYLEELILKIKSGGSDGEVAKERFREIFEVDAILYAERGIRKRYHKDTMKEDTTEMASHVVNELLNEIEKGSFDFCDEQGNILLNEQGEPKIRNLGGAIWRKMEFLFSDLMREPSPPLASYNNEPIFEQKLKEYLRDLLSLEKDETIQQRLRNKIAQLNRIIREKALGRQIVIFLQEMAKSGIKNPFDALLEKEESYIARKGMFWDCFESLSSSQKGYISFVASGFSQVEVASLLGVSPPAVNQALTRARENMTDCLQGKGIENFTEIYGG